MSEGTIVKTGKDWKAVITWPLQMPGRFANAYYRQCDLTIQSETRVDDWSEEVVAPTFPLLEQHSIRFGADSVDDLLIEDRTDQPLDRHYVMNEGYDSYQGLFAQIWSPELIRDQLGMSSLYSVHARAQAIFRLPTKEEVARYNTAAGLPTTRQKWHHHSALEFGGSHVFVGAIQTIQGTFPVVVNYSHFFRRNEAPIYLHQAIVKGSINFNNSSLMAMKRNGRWDSGTRGGVDVYALDKAGF